jgi:hypothetical protein
VAVSGLGAQRFFRTRHRNVDEFVHGRLALLLSLTRSA